MMSEKVLIELRAGTALPLNTTEVAEFVLAAASDLIINVYRK